MLMELMGTARLMPFSVSLSIIIPWAASSKLLSGALKIQETGLKMKGFKVKKSLSFIFKVILKLLCTWVTFFNIFCHLFYKTRGYLVLAQI